MASQARTYLFLCTLLTGSWTFARLPLCLLLFLGSFALTLLLPAKGSFTSLLPPRLPTRLNFFYGLAPLLGLSLQWLLGRASEFPMMGEHAHHVFVLYELSMRALWFFAIPLLAFLFAELLAKKVDRRYTDAGLLALFVAGGLITGIVTHLARTPSAAYYLAIPVEILGRSVGWMEPGAPLALVNSLAWVAYLWVLRPHLLGAWPDFRAFFACAAWLVQKDYLHYSTSVYPEPWACVLMLLSLELTVKSGTSREKALYLSGAAACFSDLAIFLFPVIWLLGAGMKPWRAPRTYHLLAAVAASPFLVYLSFRSAIKLPQRGGISIQSWISSPRIPEYFARLQEHLGLLGIFSLALFIAWVIWRSFKPIRLTPLICLGGALSIELFYLVGTFFQGWTGHPRYRLLTWLLFSGAGLHLLQAMPKLERELRWLLVILATAFLPYTVLSWARLQNEGPSTMNFSEHYDAPVFFPLGQLLAANAPEKHTKLIVNDPLPAGRLYFGMVNGYPKVFENYEFTYLKTSEGAQPVCRCDAGAPFSGVLLLGLPGGSVRGHGAWIKGLPAERLEACAKELESSCHHVQVVRTGSGDLWGALGTNSVP